MTAHLQEIYKGRTVSGYTPTGEFRAPKARERYVSSTGGICVSHGRCPDPRIILEAVVDEQHPPEGYRLVTQGERESCLKPKEALLFFDSFFDSSRWYSMSMGGVCPSEGEEWFEGFAYAVPNQLILVPRTPKVTKLTVAEVAERLGLEKVEIVKG